MQIPFCRPEYPTFNVMCGKCEANAPIAIAGAKLRTELEPAVPTWIMDWKASVSTPSKLSFKGTLQSDQPGPTRASPAPVNKSWLVHLGKRTVISAVAKPQVSLSHAKTGWPSNLLPMHLHARSLPCTAAHA